MLGPLKDAGAAALLAGEATHGAVPEELVETCARYDFPVAAVPAHVMFRAITDTVYLRQWSELSHHHALPEHVRGRLNRLVAQDTDPALILAAAFAHLDSVAAYILTPTGRTIASTPGATRMPAHEAATLPGGNTGMTVPVDAGTVTPYERWRLHLPDAAAVPPRLLYEITAVLGRCQEAQADRRAAEYRRADELGRLLATSEAGGLPTAMRACGLPHQDRYRIVVADTHADHKGLARGALTEAVAHASPQCATVGQLPDGTAFAVVSEAAVEALADAWLLVACEPGVVLHGGLASSAAEQTGLPGALAEARYALNSARATGRGTSSLTDAATFTALHPLLTGIPAEVRTAYSRTVLGPLLDIDNASAAVLLHTLEAFLFHDGSWSRTAQALHLHVNTVHYRIQRVEHFTGRDLSSLRDRLDLWAALLCRRDPSHSTTACTTAPRARSSTSPAR